MVTEADRDIVDKRLEDTLDLFKPTAQQEAAAKAVEEKGKAEPVKSRKFESEHPAFSFRILPEDNERIKDWAERWS